MLPIAFLSLLIIIAYIYVGYPLLLWVIGSLRRKTVHRRSIQPSITIVISAYNEAALIRKTVLNKVECGYPPGKREVIVVSDGSDDGTDDIVRAIGHPEVRLIRQNPRQGKTSALNRAVEAARGEIIVFSDANSLYGEEALQNLVGNFADPEVGYVTGRMAYQNPEASGIGDSCGAYMKYENALRTLETRCGSIVGVDGGIDAVRKNLYVEMPHDMLPDLAIPLSVVEQGYRVIYEPRATVSEDALSSYQREFRMRVRVTLRALHAMWQFRRMLSPFKHGLFSLQLFSHKLLRYSVPFMLIGLAVLNAWMIGRGRFWAVAFAGQCVFYGIAALGYFLLPLRRRLPSAVYFPFYFALLNWAALVAWVRFLRKKKQTTWVPRTG